MISLVLALLATLFWFKDSMPYEQQDLVASLIEEADFSASLAETLHQVARRVKREKFSAQAQDVVTAALTRLEIKLRDLLPDYGVPSPSVPAGHVKFSSVEALREKTLLLGSGVSSGERGAILALLGSIERAELLIQRIDAERKPVNRAEVIAHAREPRTKGDYRPDLGGLSPQPAE